MLSEVGLTEKDKYCMVSLIYGFKKKKNRKQMHKQYKTKTDSETKNMWMVARVEEVGGMGEKGDANIVSNSVISLHSDR